MVKSTPHRPSVDTPVVLNGPSIGRIRRGIEDQFKHVNRDECQSKESHKKQRAIQVGVRLAGVTWIKFWKERRELMYPRMCYCLHHADGLFHRLLQLLIGTQADLTHALTRNTKFIGKVP